VGRGARVSASPTYDLAVSSDPTLVTIYGGIRPWPVDDGRREELSITRGTYEEARDALVARVPEGWQLLGLSPWPCHADAGDNETGEAARSVR